jgi:DNA-binding transcriptional regulator YiaG
MDKPTELMSRLSSIVADNHGSRHCGTVTTTAAAAVAEQIHIRRKLPPPQVRRALREANGLSAADLARPLHVTRQAVSKWECGKRTPRGELLQAYLAVLDELAAALSREGSS